MSFNDRFNMSSILNKVILSCAWHQLKMSQGKVQGSQQGRSIALENVPRSKTSNAVLKCLLEETDTLTVCDTIAIIE